MASTASTMKPESGIQPAEKHPISFWDRYNIGRILLYLALTFGAVVAITPFVYMILGSLLTRGEMMNRKLFPKDPVAGLQNYVQAWNEANFNEYFINSVLITSITIAGMLFVCVLAAYAFARVKFPGRDAIFGIFLATMMIPETILLIPNFLIVNRLHKLMEPIGLPWLNNWPSLTIPFMASVFGIFLMRQFFTTIPDELWDAARIDGAGHVRFLVQVVLPLSKAVLFTVVIFQFIGSWNALVWPLVVTSKPDWRPIAVGLYSFISEAGPELQLMLAGAVITTAPVLILYFFTQKQFTEGIATTGLKG
ncbi:MAG TPA: carbohydrate ABC transporter permease [Anaerolineae bacterium]|nr:carbohydrate ABC transporter permease [Anaerolineae bacterium]